MYKQPDDRLTVSELLAEHSDRIRHLQKEGNGYTNIANILTEYTGRTCTRSTARNAVRKMRLAANEARVSGTPPKPPARPALVDVSPVRPEEVEESIDDLLRRRMAETARNVRKTEARYKVCQMPTEPFGLAFFGDPHLDDPGCRWDLLFRDVKAASSPGVYCVSVGDHQNHWIGRLAKIYAGQGTTASEGWRLARWFLGRGDDTADLDWLVVVGGNHDAWSHSLGFDPYQDLCRESVRYYDDAEVRLRLTFNEGDVEPLTLLVRHDFAGRSWFHPTHGPAKAAMLDHEADILAAGHLHSWAVLQQEVSGGRCPVAIRLRGYKHDDHYAREKGFLEQKNGHGAMLVVDPRATGPGRVTVFWNMEAGAAYLAALRA